jgi:coenzyme F420-0:L-glutamate ligase/coenzyme F420-1:gamma-L-glutamate ligase
LNRLSAEALAGLPEVRPGDDLAGLIGSAARQSGVEIGAGDVVAVAQKVVSKAEGRLRDLRQVEPSAEASALGARLSKDPRLVHVILDESTAILRAERGVLIVRTKHGLVCANAGVDQSNVPGEEMVALLPAAPDRSARALRAALGEQLGARPAIVICDSFGRAWRLGQADVAIGCAGLAPLDDLRGGPDAEGRELTAAIDAVADQAASAAALVRTKCGREAVVIVRGLERHVTEDDGPGAVAIIRAPAEDLFSQGA